ncbi:MAG TPA: TonB-dependent receptor [Ignavibacteriaceae bacterium]|nr:TonB-dependent receptor [Ignavibacteriaceae bacterium]
MKYFLFFLALNFSTSFGQQFTLKGKVTDGLSGEPLEGAAVFISSKNMAYTNPDGNYIIKDAAEGSFDIEVVQLGYEKFSERINIPGDTLKNFFLLPSPIELDEVIVSTSRTDKQLRNSPYSELLIGSNQIRNQTYQSLPDALKSEPGISLIREGAWGSEVSIRGLSRENVVALIDGNRISTSTDVAARFSLVDLNDIERVEIIKGASSALYGSGATGGIVNIITKSPPFNDVFSLKGYLSSGFNSVNNSSINSGSIYGNGSSWASKITGSFRKAGNLQTPSGKIKNSQFEDYSLSGNLNLAPLEDHLIKFNYQLFKANDVGIPGSSVFPNIADVRYPDEKRELFSAGYEIQNISSSLYRLSFKYSYQFIERDVENIPHAVQNIAAASGSPARRVSVLKITPNADHRSNNFQAYGNLLLSENNNLVGGIDYWDRQYRGERKRYQLIQVLDSVGNISTSTNKITGEKPLPDSKFSSLGLFAQDDEEVIKDKLSFSFGARADIIKVKGEMTLNPIYEITNGIINNSPAGQQVIWDKIEETDYPYSANIGLKYSIIEELDFTISLGLSYRSPSLEERFQYIDQGGVLRVGNPGLNPERGKSADLGIRYYSYELKIISSFFYNYFNDLVAEVPGTFEGRAAFVKTNIGKSRLYGFDISSEYNFITDFLLFTAISYVKGDDITAGGNLPEISPLNGKIGVQIGLLKNMQAEINSIIFAAQNETARGEIKTPGYAVFNGSLNSNLLSLSGMNLSISAGIENILNKSYRDHLSTARGSITTEPGRNIFFKLNFNW